MKRPTWPKAFLQWCPSTLTGEFHTSGSVVRCTISLQERVVLSPIPVTSTRRRSASSSPTSTRRAWKAAFCIELFFAHDHCSYYDGQHNDARHNVLITLTAMQNGACASNYIHVSLEDRAGPHRWTTLRRIQPITSLESRSRTALEKKALQFAARVSSMLVVSSVMPYERWTIQRQRNWLFLHPVWRRSALEWHRKSHCDWLQIHT